MRLMKLMISNLPESTVEKNVSMSDLWEMILSIVIVPTVCSWLQPAPAHAVLTFTEAEADPARPREDAAPGPWLTYLRPL